MFLNPDRGHLPDIDSDFGPTRGSEVFEHLNKLYGKENCCNIVTFSNLQTKAIIKEAIEAATIKRALNEREKLAIRRYREKWMPQ